MAGCFNVFGEIGQLAHNAALGVAAIYGNAGIAPCTASEIASLPEGKTENYLTAENVAFAATPLFEIDAPAVRDVVDLRDHLINRSEVRLSTDGHYSTGGYAFFNEDNEKIGQSATQESDSAADVSIPKKAFEPSVQSQYHYDELLPLAMDPGKLSSGEMAIDLGNNGSSQELMPNETASIQNAASGGLRLNAGYSSIEGITVGGKITRKKIFGLDTELGASARYSKVRASYEIAYTDHNFFGSKFAFAPTLFVDRISAKNFGKGLRLAPFRQTTRGINILLDRKFDDGLSAAANYRLSNDSLDVLRKNRLCDSSIFGSAICDTIGKTTSSILSIALTYNESTRLAERAHNFRLQLLHDLSVGGSASFSRTRVSGEAHVELGGGWKFSLDVEGGYIAQIGKKHIPLFDRFYVDDSRMRGFDLRGIGPKIRPSGARANENVGVGGRAYYLTRSEISLALGGAFGANGIRPGIFVDAGSVFAASKGGLLPGEKLYGNSAKPRVSVGIGLALSTPVVKLRIDFAKPIFKQEGDRAKMLSISFGAAI